MAFEFQTLVQDENTSTSLDVQKRTKKDLSSQNYSKRWTVPENILYARYLKTHMSQMTNQKKKKCGKFIKMANFIGSKTENQCRSHHQKMMLTFHSIQNIIKYAAQLKKSGQLITPEEYQSKNRKDLEVPEQISKMEKIEDEAWTERQSELTIKQKKEDEIKTQNCFINDFPVAEEESVQAQNYMDYQDIFDVLNIDVVAEYSHYFSC